MVLVASESIGRRWLLDWPWWVAVIVEANDSASIFKPITTSAIGERLSTLVSAHLHRKSSRHVIECESGNSTGSLFPCSLALFRWLGVRPGIQRGAKKWREGLHTTLAPVASGFYSSSFLLRRNSIRHNFHINLFPSLVISERETKTLSIRSRHETIESMEMHAQFSPTGRQAKTVVIYDAEQSFLPPSPHAKIDSLVD